MYKSKFHFVLIIISLALSFTFGQSNVHELNLMPYPAKVELKNGKLKIDENFSVAFSENGTDRVEKYAQRFLARLAGRTGIFFNHNDISEKTNSGASTLLINCGREGKLIINEDESYHITIDEKSIHLSSPTDIGTLRGLETILQLLSSDSQGYYFPSVEINDNPRFTWRGLLIDAARHFIPVEVIKRNLDAMAAVKMNVLHWHLTDDQGFRVECKTFPKLIEFGSDGNYYTQVQIKEIINYAKERGIRVIPEFDIPGHSTSWLAAYPELASAPGPFKLERRWGVFNPVFDPTKEETYEFFDKFFSEMSKLFADEFIHIGGDENNGKQWSANPNIQKFMKEKGIADNRTLQGYFNERILKILTKYNKKMLGWEEIFVDNMPKDIVLHSWLGVESLVKAAQKGYQAILSSGYYIDLIQPTSTHYVNDPIPADSKLTEAEKKFVLGGEATMWAEFVNTETIDSRIWPRTAAIAERFWSLSSVNNVDDMYRRLDYISLSLEELGLTHEKNVSMMLRRLTNNNDVNSLKIFVDVVEPVKNYARNGQREHTSLSPLTRVVDAARPDAKVAREFSKAVEKYLNTNSQETFNEISNLLILWRNNHQKLVKVINGSPVLKEIESLSGDLSSVGMIGLEALKYLSMKQNPGADWCGQQLTKLGSAKLPRGQVELVVIKPIEAMVKSLMKL